MPFQDAPYPQGAGQFERDDGHDNLQRFASIQITGEPMKTFDELFIELQVKTFGRDPESSTVAELDKGKHFIGKKILEEAGEVWMAAEHEGRERAAEEISQLLYHIQVMMLACDLGLEDVYRHL